MTRNNFVLTDADGRPWRPLERVAEMSHTNPSRGDQSGSTVGTYRQPARAPAQARGNAADPSTLTVQARGTLTVQAGAQFVSEYTAAKESVSLILTVAAAKGLVANDTIEEGSLGRWLDMSAAEREALAADRIAELGKPYASHATTQAATYRAAFKVAGVEVPEFTERHLDRMAAQAEYTRKRLEIINSMVDAPETRRAAAAAMGIG